MNWKDDQQSVLVLDGKIIGHNTTCSEMSHGERRYICTCAGTFYEAQDGRWLYIVDEKTEMIDGGDFIK